MKCKIKGEGYEYRGIKLGQKCIFEGEETIVIGFDEDELPNGFFIMVKYYNLNKTNDGGFATVLLEGYNESSYLWATSAEISIIKSNNTCISIQPQISPSHALDILEDEINQINYRYGIPEPHLTRMNECVKLIKEGWRVK